MRVGITRNKQARLSASLGELWKDPQDRRLVTNAIQALDSGYDLAQKIAQEPGVEQILLQMFGRLAEAYPALSLVRNKKILDIACGSNTSKLPGSLYVNTPFGELSFGHTNKGYTALFEPWFCRILFALDAHPVGIDFGDLEAEAFQHYRVDLGKKGALDFLPDHSFEGIQDSRLFGSPEFTVQFPKAVDRLAVAREIRRQEKRLLKPGGIIIHSDAKALVE